MCSLFRNFLPSCLFYFSRCWLLSDNILNYVYSGGGSAEKTPQPLGTRRCPGAWSHPGILRGPAFSRPCPKTHHIPEAFRIQLIKRRGKLNQRSRVTVNSRHPPPLTSWNHCTSVTTTELKNGALVPWHLVDWYCFSLHPSVPHIRDWPSTQLQTLQYVSVCVFYWIFTSLLLRACVYAWVRTSMNLHVFVVQKWLLLIYTRKGWEEPRTCWIYFWLFFFSRSANLVFS